MKVQWLVLVLSFLLISTVSASSSERWVGFGTASETDVEVTVISSGLDGVALRIHVPGALVDDATTPGGDFARLTLPPYGHSVVIGEALLPVVREFIEIPQGAEPSVRVTGVRHERFSLTSLGVDRALVPVQGPVEKIPGAIESAPFEISDEFYRSDAFLPAEQVRVGEIRQLRGHRFVQLEVTPIRYNPSLAEIEIATEIDVTIDFAGGDAAETRRVLDRYSNGRFERLARDLFLNHSAFVSRYDISLPIGYLIVVHDNFYDQILPLKAWKDLKGYETTIVRTSEIPGGATKQNIQAYIQDAYDNWPVPPTFVLLVGDTAYVPYWVGTQSSSPATDLYYVTMDGSNDWDPDIWIGRFSCTSTSQVTNLVNKTVDYERYDLASGTDWIKKAVFMASEDNYTVSEGTHNYVIREYFQPAGYYTQTLYMHTYNATTAQVRAAFNDGRSMGIYSGHGAVTYWADGPQFMASDVNGLTNTDMLPLVHSYSCLTGQFSSACFGETWINATDKGALVFWGSSVTSYWGEDDVLEKGAFEAAFVEGYTWACGISHRALYHLYDYYGVPTTIDASYPGQIPAGSGSFSITVSSGRDPVETALVCVRKEDEGIYGTAYTDAFGQATIALDPSPTLPGDLEVTVTKHNYYPHEGTALISLADVPYCLYHSHVIDDDNDGGSSGNGDGRVAAGESIELKLSLENVGLDDAYGRSARRRRASRTTTSTSTADARTDT